MVSRKIAIVRDLTQKSKISPIIQTQRQLRRKNSIWSLIQKTNTFNVIEMKWYHDIRYNRYLKWVKQNKDGDEEE